MATVETVELLASWVIEEGLSSRVFAAAEFDRFTVDELREGIATALSLSNEHYDEGAQAHTPQSEEWLKVRDYLQLVMWVRSLDGSELGCALRGWSATEQRWEERPATVLGRESAQRAALLANEVTRRLAA